MQPMVIISSRRCSSTQSFHASFFFFQAEDGIRDHCVTGVQTCALPISQDGARTIVSKVPNEDELSTNETRICAGQGLFWRPLTSTFTVSFRPLVLTLLACRGSQRPEGRRDRKSVV